SYLFCSLVGAREDAASIPLSLACLRWRSATDAWCASGRPAPVYAQSAAVSTQNAYSGGRRQRTDSEHARSLGRLAQTEAAASARRSVDPPSGAGLGHGIRQLVPALRRSLQEAAVAARTGPQAGADLRAGGDRRG